MVFDQVYIGWVGKRILVHPEETYGNKEVTFGRPKPNTNRAYCTDELVRVQKPPHYLICLCAGLGAPDAELSKTTVAKYNLSRLVISELIYW